MQTLLLEDSKNCKELSIYGEGKVSAEALAACFVTIKKAFPKLSIGWYEILEEALDDENFTDQRLLDATKNLVKTCVYPEPTIANLIGFDKKVELMSYNDILKHTENFSDEARRKYFDSLELFDKDRKLWRAKRV